MPDQRVVWLLYVDELLSCKSAFLIGLAPVFSNKIIYEDLVGLQAELAHFAKSVFSYLRFRIGPEIKEQLRHVQIIAGVVQRAAVGVVASGHCGSGPEQHATDFELQQQ